MMRITAYSLDTENKNNTGMLFLFRISTVISHLILKRYFDIEILSFEHSLSNFNLQKVFIQQSNPIMTFPNTPI